jgi:hypothetical protein
MNVHMVKGTVSKHIIKLGAMSKCSHVQYIFKLPVKLNMSTTKIVEKCDS